MKVKEYYTYLLVLFSTLALFRLIFVYTNNFSIFEYVLSLVGLFIFMNLYGILMLLFIWIQRALFKEKFSSIRVIVIRIIIVSITLISLIAIITYVDDASNTFIYPMAGLSVIIFVACDYQLQEQKKIDLVRFRDRKVFDVFHKNITRFKR